MPEHITDLPKIPKELESFTNLIQQEMSIKHKRVEIVPIRHGDAWCRFIRAEEHPSGKATHQIGIRTDKPMSDIKQQIIHELAHVKAPAEAKGDIDWQEISELHKKYGLPLGWWEELNPMPEHITNLPKGNPTTIIPWQMTREEFVDAQKKDYEEAGLELREGTKLAEKFESYQKDYHKEWVETALKEGKPVSAKVLRDCPELKKKYTQYFKGGDNPMNEHIKDTGLGVGSAPKWGKPKTEKERKEEHIRRHGTEELPPRGSGLNSIDKYSGQPIILINIETGKVIPGGRVVSEKKALATGCHGYDIGEGKRMLWSKGVVGTLSLPEQKKYCKVGMDIKPMTGGLKRRITALREAGIEF